MACYALVETASGKLLWSEAVHRNVPFPYISGYLAYRELPKAALYVAGVAHRHYRRAGGLRQSILADFLIGAHAAVLGCGILTRDARRYRNYFPRVEVIAPAI